MHQNKKMQISVAILCFLLFFCVTLQYKSVTKNKSLGISEAKRIQDIECKLINANQEIINLKKENLKLQSDIEVYRKEAASSDSGAGALRSELEKTLMIAGLTEVEGPGIEINLADSSESASQGESAESSIVHDTDLRNVVNELFAAGAEAVSVNGERFVSGSSIRCVGNTIMINDKRYSSPFVIKAIGNADSLESAMNIRGGVLDVLKLYKIQVNVTKSSSVKLEKYNGNLSWTYAEKAGKQVIK